MVRKFTAFIPNNGISMRNIITLIATMAFMILMGANRAPGPQYIVKKIVIDAGHGGHDPGARGSRGSKEKDIALKIALQLGKLVKKHMKDVQVIYTRQDDQFVTLHERAKIANKNNVDLFISIHCNATPDRAARVHGTETYTMGLHTSRYNLEVAKRENAVVLLEDSFEENYQGFYPKAPESHILFSLYQNTYNNHSVKLAQKIQQEFKVRLGRKCRGVNQAGFLVLWKTAAPSVLVEAGFITNPKEEKYLNSRYGQARIAESIFRAFRDYKKELESSH